MAKKLTRQQHIMTAAKGLSVHEAVKVLEDHHKEVKHQAKLAELLRLRVIALGYVEVSCSEYHCHSSNCLTGADEAIAICKASDKNDTVNFDKIVAAFNKFIAAKEKQGVACPK